MTLPEKVDVTIVGAGTAGAAAAALCAERGLRVLCLDRSPLDRAGAHWVNGVPAWSFAEAGFELPRGEELRGDGGPFHLIAGRGPHRVVIDDHGVLEVDMRHLVARLQQLAKERGAILAGQAAVREVRGDRVEVDGQAIRSRWIVDASGLAGLNLLGSPKVGGEHLCAAAQRVHRLADRGGAERFFAEHGTPLGLVACFTAIEGGFSILNVRVEDDHVSILTGSIPALGFKSGKAILDQFVAEQPWIGEAIFGGSRAIPLRRPFDRIARDNVAAIGDAASQVFPAHGSGIGSGMIAAKELADALASGGGPEAYAFNWQRRWGGLHASYDLFRRFSQTLCAAELESMIETGLMDPELARFGLAQAHPRPSLRSVPGKLAALARTPRLAGRLAATVSRMLAVRALYARYPRNSTSLKGWSRRVARVFDEVPDAAAV